VHTCSYLQQAGNGELLFLYLHIQPKSSKTRVTGLYDGRKSSKTRVTGLYDGRLKIAVASPPVDGKANKEVLAFLAGLLGVKKNTLSLRSGAHSRRKVIAITSLSVDEANRIISEYLGKGNE